MSDKDIMLGGYLIPRNTMIWCNLNATMSNPDLWDRPEEFLPVSLLLPASLMQCGYSQAVEIGSQHSDWALAPGIKNMLQPTCGADICEAAALLKARIGKRLLDSVWWTRRSSNAPA